jgi:hypothetical protein
MAIVDTGPPYCAVSTKFEAHGAELGLVRRPASERGRAEFARLDAAAEPLLRLEDDNLAAAFSDLAGAVEARDPTADDYDFGSWRGLLIQPACTALG